MAAKTTQTICFRVNPFLSPRPTTAIGIPALNFSPSVKQITSGILRYRRKPSLTVCFVVEDEKLNAQLETSEEDGEDRQKEIAKQISDSRVAEKLARKRSERHTYLVAAVMSSLGITSMAVLAVYSRFSWQMEVRIKFIKLL